MRMSDEEGHSTKLGCTVWTLVLLFLALVPIVVTAIVIRTVLP
jgi:hypothetical protein